MPLLPFRKKKPATSLSINKNFYLSVLSPTEQLPPLLQIVNPDGSNGAVRGYIAPLSPGASKDLLNAPLVPGAYVATTTDKLTIIQLDTFTRRQLPQFSLPQEEDLLTAVGLIEPKRAKAQNTKYITNLTIRGYDPGVYISVQFFIDIARRLAELTDGVVADPLADAYRAPDELRLSPKLDQRIDFREIGSIKVTKLEDGNWLSTRGMVKFLLPEYEMYGIPDEYSTTGALMLASACQQCLIGLPMKEGDTAFSSEEPLVLVKATRRSQHWADRPVLEFKDSKGNGAAQGVAAWAKAQI